MSSQPPPAPQPPSGRAQADRSTSAVVKDVVAGTQQLVRQELELARIELMENVETKVQAAGAGAAAGVLASYLLFFLGMAAAFGLGEVMPLWAGFLVVAGVMLLIIAVLGLFAKSRAAARPLLPEKSIARVQEELTWVKKLKRR